MTPDDLSKQSSLPTAQNALVFTTNEAFAEGFLVTFASALITSDLSEFNIYIGHDKTETIKSLWESILHLCERFNFPKERCRALPINYDQFKQYQAFENGTRQTYGRHYLASILTEPVFLYLDSDMLVLSDLSELVQLLPPDKLLAAVRDHGDSTHAEDPYTLDGQKDLEDRSPYFNAGLLLINTKKYQAIEPLKRFDELRTRIENVCYHDQTYFNILTKGQWHPLPSMWNSITLPNQPYPIQNENSLIGILHFIGSQKPWIRARLNAPSILWHIIASIIDLPTAHHMTSEYQALMKKHHKQNRLYLKLKLRTYQILNIEGRKMRRIKHALELHKLTPLLNEWLRKHLLDPAPKVFRQL